jgi:hypothetical protein
MWRPLLALDGLVDLADKEQARPPSHCAKHEEETKADLHSRGHTGGEGRGGRGVSHNPGTGQAQPV